jgi:hypothetical protein
VRAGKPKKDAMKDGKKSRIDRQRGGTSCRILFRSPGGVGIYLSEQQQPASGRSRPGEFGEEASWVGSRPEDANRKGATSRAMQEHTETARPLQGQEELW